MTPQHHIRYARAWDLRRAGSLTPEAVKTLEDEMDAAQNEFSYEEFQQFKARLPGFVAFWDKLWAGIPRQNAQEKPTP